MTIRYDNTTDSIYLILSEDTVIESEEVEEGVIVDYNAKDEVVAIEVLHVKENMHTIDLPIVLQSA